MINNFIAYLSASYIRDFTVVKYLRLIWRSSARSPNELQSLDLRVGHRGNGDNNGHQGDDMHCYRLNYKNTTKYVLEIRLWQG